MRRPTTALRSRKSLRARTRESGSSLTQNLGPHASYNEAIDWASSDYFLLLDADDFLHEGAIGHATKFLDSHDDVVMTYGRASYLTPDGAIQPGNQVDPQVDWEIICGDALIREFCAHPVHMIPSPTVIRRTSHQKQAGYYRTALQYTDDMEMWLRLATLGKVARTGHPQAVQRFHSTRHTNQFLETLVWDFTEREKAIRSFFQLEGAGIPDADKMSALATRSLGCHAYWAGLSQIISGNRILPTVERSSALRSAAVQARFYSRRFAGFTNTNTRTHG